MSGWNFRRGLVRMWLVVSVPWMAWECWQYWPKWVYPSFATSDRTNPDGSYIMKMLDPGGYYILGKHWTLWAIGDGFCHAAEFPVALAIVMLVGCWIVRGFRDSGPASMMGGGNAGED